ncbi:MAG: CoA transferase, partial [Pseudomonadota bacterium]
DPTDLPHQNDTAKWPEMKALFSRIFKTKTRDEWTAVFEGTDACVAPVLELNEVDGHLHNRERELLLEVDDVLQPAPAPRLSRTPGRVERLSRPRGSETREVLQELGYSSSDIEAFFTNKTVGQM